MKSRDRRLFRVVPKSLPCSARCSKNVDQLDHDLTTLLDSAVPLGVLSDIIAHALGLPSEMKQDLLGEPSVERRASTLRSILRQVVDKNDVTPSFPPPFSTN